MKKATTKKATRKKAVAKKAEMRKATPNEAATKKAAMKEAATNKAATKKSTVGNGAVKRNRAKDGEVGAILVALADPTRRAILDVVASAGEATATAAARELPVSRQAIVKHLDVLDRAGLVRSRRRGREVRWSVRPERLEKARDWLSALASEWDARLATIRRIAEEDT